MKQSKKKNITPLVSIAAIAIVGVCGFIFWSSRTKTANAATESTQVKTTILRQMDLVDYIYVSGTLYSGNSQNVYTTKSYPIKEIYVEVGDVVKAGDVLAVLDMTDLDYDIESAERSLENSKKSEKESIQNASNSITNARSSVESSKLNLEKSQSNYDSLKSKLESGTSNELINAQNTIDSSEQTLDTSKKDLDKKTADHEANKLLFAAGALSQNELDTSQRSVDDAQKSYNTALSNYNKAIDTYNRTKKSLEDDLVSAARDLESTKLSYQNSLNSLSQAQQKSGNVTSNVETQEISLQRLKENRSEAEIIAPIDGTITAVNATVGMTGAGASGSGSSGSALFVVEDMNDLYVSSSIKEFRIGEVSKGQSAYVTTDATSDKMFKSHLSFIAPTATSTSSTSNVEFEVKINLEETDQNLRIGMNAYANIILDSADGVYAVPYDALYTTRSGESFIYAVENGVTVEVPVTTGLETDTMIEVSGDSLRDGMIIASDASQVTTGQAVEIPSGQGFAPRENVPSGAVPSGAPAQGVRTGSRP